MSCNPLYSILFLILTRKSLTNVCCNQDTTSVALPRRTRYSCPFRVISCKQKKPSLGWFRRRRHLLKGYDDVHRASERMENWSYIKQPRIAHHVIWKKWSGQKLLLLTGPPLPLAQDCARSSTITAPANAINSVDSPPAILAPWHCLNPTSSHGWPLLISQT